MLFMRFEIHAKRCSITSVFELKNRTPFIPICACYCIVVSLSQNKQK